MTIHLMQQFPHWSLLTPIGSRKLNTNGSVNINQQRKLGMRSEACNQLNIWKAAFAIALSLLHRSFKKLLLVTASKIMLWSSHNVSHCHYLVYSKGSVASDSVHVYCNLEYASAIIHFSIAQSNLLFNPTETWRFLYILSFLLMYSCAPVWLNTGLLLTFKPRNSSDNKNDWEAIGNEIRYQMNSVHNPLIQVYF